MNLQHLEACLGTKLTLKTLPDGTELFIGVSTSEQLTQIGGFKLLQPGSPKSMNGISVVVGKPLFVSYDKQ